MRLRPTICLLLLLALRLDAQPAKLPSTQPAPAYGPWQSSRFGGGGYIQDVIPTRDPNRFYAYVDVGGMYRSDDGGRTWRMLHGALPPEHSVYFCRGLTVDPTDSSRLLVAVGEPDDPSHGLLLSTDAGQTFTRVLTAPFHGNGPERMTGSVLAWSPHDPQVILTGSRGGGIFRSADAGQTWTRVGPERVNFTDIAFARDTEGGVWACAVEATTTRQHLDGGLFHSDDGGLSWSKLADEGPAELVQEPAGDKPRLVGLFDGTVVRASGDGGRTWTDLHDGLPRKRGAGRASSSQSTGFNAITAGPDYLLLASGDGEVYRLNAGDAVWQPVQRKHIDPRDWWGNVGQRPGWTHFGRGAASITIDPVESDRWFMTDWYAVWRTEDAGRTWTYSADGIESTVVHSITVDPSDPRIVHVGMADNGYLRSDDHGRTFRQIRGTGAPNNVKDVALSPADPKRLYALGPRERGWNADQVYISADSGSSWAKAADAGLPGQREMYSIAVDRPDPKRIYLGLAGPVGDGGGGVYVSDDAAASWRWLGQGLPVGKAFFHDQIWNSGREIAVDAAGQLVCISRRTRGVYFYDQATGRWTASAIDLSGDPYALAADALKPGLFVLGVRGRDGGIYISDDAGRSWRRTHDASTTHVAADATSAGRLLATVQNGILRSDDGGRTWRALDPRLPHRGGRNIPALAGNRVWAGSNGSGIFWMDLPPQDDAALTWP
jgi:photosystem II stability/assembly factor-like uncharacterized protein